MLNLWSYTSTFSIHLHGVQWHNEQRLTTSWLTECVYFILTNNDIEEQNLLQLILTLSTKILSYFRPCFCMHQGLCSFELSKPMMKDGDMTLLPSSSRDPITSMPVTMSTPTPVICTNTTRLAASITNRHKRSVISTKIHYCPTFRIFLYLQNLHVCPIYCHVLMLTTALSSVPSLRTMLYYW
jgi:hypothetical protein